MRINVFCILIFCCVFFCYGNHIHFKHINVKDGLSQITVLSIYQDEVGTLWFGSSEGLNRYNGDKIDIYRPSQNDNLPTMKSAPFAETRAEASISDPSMI